MKKLILLLIIASAFASGIKAQYVDGVIKPQIPSESGGVSFVKNNKNEWVLFPDSRGYQMTPEIKAQMLKNSTSEMWPAPEPDTINYLVIFRDTTKDVNGQVIYPVSLTQKIVGFKTQTTLGGFLNERVDSTNLTAIYDVRTKKPMKASSSIEDKVVERVIQERQRQRKWVIK